ncbi:Uncharacterised protein [Vibrio cholerae]|nr:Uncharacterised protein [Vibrio cholerae]CSB33787.1 Uncharacterised protein [Vibrio cholerae]CSB50668.1 Uncharacterised protein [Vibrio cholerae]CSI67043.1 Uncharacterised protein [Vibrio cholerae]
MLFAEGALLPSLSVDSAVSDKVCTPSSKPTTLRLSSASGETSQRPLPKSVTEPAVLLKLAPAGR